MALPKDEFNNELPEVKEIQVLEFKPGDTLVLKCDGSISISAVERIKETMNVAFPDNKVIVLSDGMNIEAVLRSA